MAPLRLTSLALLLAFLPSINLLAQEAPGFQEGSGTVRLYLDCNAMDCFNMDYNRQEVPFVDPVRDTQDADLYLLVTGQATGAGGMSLELIYERRGRFAGMADTLNYVSMPNSTSDERRRGLLGILAQSLSLGVGYTQPWGSAYGSVEAGVTLRFGSIFNNVVNPRLEGPGGGGMIMIM